MKIRIILIKWVGVNDGTLKSNVSDFISAKAFLAQNNKTALGSKERTP